MPTVQLKQFVQHNLQYLPVRVSQQKEIRKRDVATDLSVLFFVQNLGMKVYSQGPRFDLKIVRDSGKPKISWWNTGCGLFQKGSAIRQQFYSEFWHEIRYWERKAFSGKKLQKFGMRDCHKRDREYGTRKVLINVPQRPQVLRHFPFQGNWSQFPAFSASLQRISSCKSWQTKKHNKTVIFYSKCSQVHLTFESE